MGAQAQRKPEPTNTLDYAGWIAPYRRTKDAPELFRRYLVSIQVRDRILGGWPKELRAELAMMEARVRQGLIPKEMLEETKAKISDSKEKHMDAEEAADEAVLQGWCGFQRDPQERVAINTRSLKAMFKECANVLRLASEGGGEDEDGKKIKGGYRGARQVLQHAYFVKATGADVDPTRDWVHFGKGEPDGYLDHIVHAITPQGPRSSIKRSDFIVKPLLSFEVWTMAKGVIDSTFIERALELAQETGIGACRSQGYGKFDVVEYKAL